MKRIYCNPEYCVNCHLCEVNCVLVHSGTDDLIEAYKGVHKPAGILIEEEHPVSFALQCRHCDEPQCVMSCLTGALYKDMETGRILYKEEKCVGCGTCLVACPYGAIKKVDTGGRHFKVTKCDLCLGRSEPACVDACPNLALKFEDRGETR